MSQRRPDAEFTIQYETLKGEVNSFVWHGLPLRRVNSNKHPHTQAGIQYMDNGNHVFIPWHQIKISWFNEK